MSTVYGAYSKKRAISKPLQIFQFGFQIPVQIWILNNFAAHKLLIAKLHCRVFMQFYGTSVPVAPTPPQIKKKKIMHDLNQDTLANI